MVRMDLPPRWPEKELQDRSFHSKSRVAYRYRQSQVQTPVAQPAPSPIHSTHTTVPGNDNPIPGEPEPIPKGRPSMGLPPSHVPGYMLATGINSVLSKNQQDAYIDLTAPRQLQPQSYTPPWIPGNDHDFRTMPNLQGTEADDPYSEVPPRDHGRQPVDGDLFLKFVKAWDKKQNFSGDRYHILDDKVRMFLRICGVTGIPMNQAWAVFPHILTGRAETYYNHHVKPQSSFYQQYWAIKAYFDTESNHAIYYRDWTSISLARIRQENGGKTWEQAVDALIEKLHLCQRALGREYEGDKQLTAALVRSCQGISEFSEALSEPVASFEALVSRLRVRASVLQDKDAARIHLAGTDEAVDMPSTHFTDRKFMGRTSRGKPQGQKPWRRQNRQDDGYRPKSTGKCYICKDPMCRSWRHSEEEQREARERYNRGKTSDRAYRAFLMDFERNCNIDLDSEDDEDAESDDDSNAEAYFMVATRTKPLCIELAS